jgi:cyclohexyl-isocyanide hydratase
MAASLFVSDRSKPQPRTRPLSTGCLIFPQLDQIDFTGSFEVLSRMPDTTVQIVGKERAPVRDVPGASPYSGSEHRGSGTFDVLLVPGGYGRQALMNDKEVLALIRKQVKMERLLFFVCTGALLCCTAGVLTGRHVTRHWSARHLMPYYGAALVDSRIVVDGNIISAAGVTAGLSGPCAGLSSKRRCGCPGNPTCD